MSFNRIIVVGASAGGVDALLQIAARLAPDFPAPILLVLHIGAYRSFLPELLSARGVHRATFAEAGSVPRPGMIHVAPPDQHMLLESGRLQLYRGPKEHHARPAINPLFRSAALDAGPRVVGVVLTGMLDDGAAGLHAVKACGGIAVVQDPDSAEEPSMPLSAMAAVQVDHLADIETMPALLGRLAQADPPANAPRAPEWLRVEHAISLGRTSMPAISSIGQPSAFTCPDCGGALFELTQGRPLRYLCHTGHSFSLRSLICTHDEVADAALWSGLRALQEKEAILRRLAADQARERPGSEARTAAEADLLQERIAQFRDLITDAQ